MLGQNSYSGVRRPARKAVSDGAFCVSGRTKLAMDLTEAGALIPELATAALIVHHTTAKYYST